MCGINGFIFLYNDSLSDNQTVIEEMNNKISHRGPDERGYYCFENGAVGMTRLSIIDLNTGKQPISNEDETLKIVFNGEIYNYLSLREQLIKEGHVFKTGSDTEVVLHAYEQYGKNCLQYIKGMFAFAIINISNGSVFLARDRIGEKPLYYYKDSKCFIFASELKSIISTGLIDKKINKTALAQYLALTYIPAPLSIFENVYKLNAGHCMTLNENGELAIEKYWDVCFNNNNKIKDYNQCKNGLKEVLYQSVNNCMVSDVPIGAFLSGGIDSTIISGIMSKISSKPINTFSIGFADKKYDESEKSRFVAEKIGANHHEFIIDDNNIFENINAVIQNIDEPFADSSYIATYTVSKLARTYVKTVLTGDAGDELFGGYNKYLISYYSDLYNKTPKLLRDGVNKIVNKIPDTNEKTRKIHKVLDNASLDVFIQRKNLMCLSLNEENLQKLLKYDCSNSLSFISTIYNKYSDVASEMDCAFYTDIKTVLEGDMLCKVDRASMLASLETRVPMLYPDVVEYSAMIPDYFKIKKNNKKIILKDTFKDLIPKKILNAPKKGFSVPVAEWFRNELKDELVQTLNKKIIDEQGLFNYEFIELLMNQHFSRLRNNASILWSLYVFEKWYKNYFSEV